MQKLIVFNNLSIDGMFCDSRGSLDWAKHHDEELTEYVQETRGEIAAYLFGRSTFEMFASFWPTPAGRSANPYFAELLTKGKKVVFSRRLKSATWANTVILPEADVATLADLKSSAQGDLLIFGSGTLVQSLTEKRLIDEYQLLVNPVAVGSGRSMFGPLAARLELSLVEAKPFTNGTVLLRYLVKR